LFNGVALDRVTLVIDDTTDRAFLEATVGEIWQEMAPTSPNFGLSRAIVRCYAIRRQTSKELEQLLTALFSVRNAVAEDRNLAAR
jgi:hypothetical protein